MVIIAKKVESEKTEDLTKKIIDRYNAYSGFWASNYYDYNRVLLRDYRMELLLVRDPETGEIRWPYRSKIFPPQSFEKIETIAPQVVDAITGKTPWAIISRRKGRLDNGDVDKTQAQLDYQLDVRDFRGLLDEALFEVVALGNKILRPKWVYEAEWITKRRAIYELGYPVGVAEERVLEEIYEGPDVDPIAFYNFHIDPATPPGQLQKAEAVIEETVIPLWEFKADAEHYGYKNVKEAEEHVIEGHTLQSQYDGADRGTDIHAKLIRVIRYYDHDQCAFLVTNSSGVPTSGVLVKEEDLEKNHPDGKFPYFALQSRVNIDEGTTIGDDEPVPYAAGGFYCFGELHVNHGLQQATTTSLNQRIDQVGLGLNPPMFLNGEGLENEEDLEYGYEPGRIYKLMDTYNLNARDVLFQVPIQDFFGPSWKNQMEFLNDYSDRGTGAQDTISGRMDAQHQTATGVMQLTANAAKRFSRKVAIIVNRGLKPLLRHIIELNARYTDPNTIVYSGSAGDTIYINPEDIIRGADIKINTSPFYAKEIVQERILKTIPVLAQMHPFIDLTQAVKLILESDPYIDDVDAILPENTPMVTPFMMQTMMGLMQAQITLISGQGAAQQQGGNGGGAAGAVGVSGAAGGNIPKFDAAQNVNLLQKLVAGNRGI